MLTKISQHNRKWRSHPEPSIWAESEVLQITGAGLMGKLCSSFTLVYFWGRMTISKSQIFPVPCFNSHLRYLLFFCVHHCCNVYRILAIYPVHCPTMGFCLCFYFFFSFCYFVFWDGIICDASNLHASSWITGVHYHIWVLHLRSQFMIHEVELKRKGEAEHDSTLAQDRAWNPPIPEFSPETGCRTPPIPKQGIPKQVKTSSALRYN